MRDGFGSLVLRSRHAAWLTQEELAERSGLSPRTIQAIERGQVSRPHRESVRLLADALGLHGADRDRFEAAARPATTDPEPACCADLTEVAACVRRHVRPGRHGTVSLHGLGLDADPLVVLARLLSALGAESEDRYGFAGAPVSDHTFPVQVLPGA